MRSLDCLQMSALHIFEIWLVGTIVFRFFFGFMGEITKSRLEEEYALPLALGWPILLVTFLVYGLSLLPARCGELFGKLANRITK